MVQNNPACIAPSDDQKAEAKHQYVDEVTRPRWRAITAILVPPLVLAAAGSGAGWLAAGSMSKTSC